VGIILTDRAQADSEWWIDKMERATPYLQHDIYRVVQCVIEKMSERFPIYEDLKTVRVALMF